MLAFLAVFFIAAKAGATAPVRLPTVAASDFASGRSWTWDYLDQTGVIYSTERYQVLSVNGAVVLIEMSSSMSGSSSLQPHARIQVDVSRCLAAYKNPDFIQPWTIDMFYQDENGAWVSYQPPNTLAFEEKFNCNPNVTLTGSGSPTTTVFQTVSSETAFQERESGTDGSNDTWFTQSGPNAAIALLKNFTSDPHMTYVMKRR